MSEYKKHYSFEKKNNRVIKFLLHSIAFLIGCGLLYIGLLASYEVSIEKHSGYNPNIYLEDAIGDVIIIILFTTGIFLILESTNTFDSLMEKIFEIWEFITKNW